MSDPEPFATRIDLDSGLMSGFERHSVRRMGDLAGYFHIHPEGDDRLIYGYFEPEVPAEAGQIVPNISILQPGRHRRRRVLHDEGTLPPQPGVL